MNLGMKIQDCNQKVKQTFAIFVSELSFPPTRGPYRKPKSQALATPLAIERQSSGPHLAPQIVLGPVVPFDRL